ncbi:MAG: hypothetical protein NWR72_12250, partial [Bacteroidia bacterium]|nr:hypothetical protein [Bacteroidia bacterium]
MDKISLSNSDLIAIVSNSPSRTTSQTARLNFQEAAAALINPESNGIDDHFAFTDGDQTIKLKRILFKEQVLRSILSS